MLTEINDRGETVDRNKQLELIEKVKNLSKDVDIAVVSGSLPSGVKPSFYKEIVSVIPENVKVIVDTEKANMEEALSGRTVFMVKPNLRELESFTEKDIKTLEAGVTLVDGSQCRPAKVRPANDKMTKIFMTITEGKYHEIKRMLGVVNIGVDELDRVRIGKLCKDNKLSYGQYRELTPDELELVWK